MIINIKIKASLFLLLMLFLPLVKVGAQATTRYEEMIKYEKRQEYLIQHKAERKIEFDSIINNADVIFEGDFIDGTSYPVDSSAIFGEDGFLAERIICSLFKIRKIYKGHNFITFGTIQLISFSSDFGFGSREGENIVFCKLSNTTNRKPCFDSKTLNNKLILSPYEAMIPTGEDKDDYSCIYDYFPSQQKARNYLAKYPNISIKTDPQESLIGKLKCALSGEPLTTDTAQLNRAKEGTRKYDERMEFFTKKALEIDSLKKKSRKSSPLKSAQNPVDISFKLDNVKNVPGATSAERK